MKCKKTGHWATVCRGAKYAHEIEPQEQLDAYFLGSVETIQEDFWSADIKVNCHTTEFKLDSESKITVIGGANALGCKHPIGTQWCQVLWTWWS